MAKDFQKQIAGTSSITFERFRNIECDRHVIESPTVKPFFAADFTQIRSSLGVGIS